MKYLQISNDGLLPVELIPLMGGTTKKENSNKIGQFGTGLKYTIAFCTRNNVEIKMFVGKKEVIIDTEKIKISDNEFDVIRIDNVKTSITSQMGYEWEPWMIIREIWCNALDEGNPQKELLEVPFGEEGRTTIAIELTPEISNVINDWNNYFLNTDNITPLFENEEFSVYANEGPLRFYKNTILIKEEKEQKSLFNYDIKQARLNELREYKGYRLGDIREAISQSNEELIDYFIRYVKDDHYESEINLEGYYAKTITNKMKNALKGTKVISKKQSEILLKRGDDPSEFQILPENLTKGLHSNHKETSPFRSTKNVEEISIVSNPKVIEMMRNAKDTLEEADYHIEDVKFVWHVARFGDPKILGTCDFESKVIYISEVLQHDTLFKMMMVMVEENEHAVTSIGDGREMQTHFLQLFVKTLLQNTKS